jgi:hypothetical protein
LIGGFDRNGHSVNVSEIALTSTAHVFELSKLEDEKRSRLRVEDELKEVEKDRDEFKKKLDAERKKQVR